MLDKIHNILEKNNISKEDKILCAVSGGIDSSVMLYVLKLLNYPCIVVHCNFQLRGEEANGDEFFVKSLAENYSLPFDFIRFDTYSYAKKKQLSIQVAARNLRYEWFYHIAEKYNCKYIAVAHNSDDQIETALTNLIRGTGIRGLTAMSILNKKILRPLLSSSRAEIENFAMLNNIKFRTDSTNLTTKYSRNKIRLEIIPLMAEINSSVKSNIIKSIGYLKDTEKIFFNYVNKAKKSCLCYNDEKIFINIDNLNKFEPVETILYEILISENIPNKIANEAVFLLESQTGKKIIFEENFSIKFEIIRNRNFLIINKNFSENKIYFQEEIYTLDELSSLKIFYEIKKSSEIKINSSPNFAYLDYDKLKFPLIIRSWQFGDRFMPLGMNFFKKLSDFFVDRKFSQMDKDNILILLSNNNIVWIIGHRIDERYKITDKTTKALILENKKTD